MIKNKIAHIAHIIYECDTVNFVFHFEYVTIFVFEQGKENEPKDTEINRKGPMINGVRRALSSPPLISLPAEEPVSRPIEKQTKLNGKSQFKGK